MAFESDLANGALGTNQHLVLWTGPHGAAWSQTRSTPPALCSIVVTHKHHRPSSLTVGLFKAEKHKKRKKGELSKLLLPVFKSWLLNFLAVSSWVNYLTSGFPGGAVVENPPANAGDTGSSPGLGRSHMPRSSWAREPQLLSLRVWSLCSTTREAAIVRGPRTAMKSGTRLPQLEKALAQKRRPNTAINK